MRQYGGQNCTPNNTCSPTLRVSCCHSRARLASGWLAGLYREGVEPSGSLRKVSDHMVIPLSCPPDATHVPYRSPVELRAAYMPDAARAVSGISRTDPGGRVSPRFRHRLIGFRHFTDGSLALASLNHACRDLVPTFLQRSPPSLL